MTVDRPLPVSPAVELAALVLDCHGLSENRKTLRHMKLNVSSSLSILAVEIEVLLPRIHQSHAESLKRTE